MLVEEEEVKVESELYNDLKRDLGKNFKLFVDTVNLKEWKKKGPYVPPEADMGSKRNSQEIALSFPFATRIICRMCMRILTYFRHLFWRCIIALLQAFPPLLTRWSMRQTKPVVEYSDKVRILKIEF